MILWKQTFQAIPLFVYLFLGMAGAQESRVLDCDSTFSPNATVQSLTDYFGEENVASAEIHLGEGEYEKGTVLFSTSGNDEVEIIWKDVENQQLPHTVKISGKHSNWKTRKGLSLGDDLLTVEKINRKPFRLLGFGWDGSGMQISWSRGTLETGTSGECQVSIRLMPEQSDLDSKWYRQVLGDSEYSSAHPAMQALNPRIYEIRLEYLKTPYPPSLKEDLVIKSGRLPGRRN